MVRTIVFGAPVAVPRKSCSDCQEEHPVTAFNVAYTMKSGNKVYASSCKSCVSRQRQDLQRIRREVGPAPPIGSRCWACKKIPKDNKRLCCDHDHNTGVFRGWLCGRCNRSIGLMGETKERALLIYEYLDNAENANGRGEGALAHPRQSRLSSFVDSGTETRSSSDEGAGSLTHSPTGGKAGLHSHPAEQGEVCC